MKRIETGPHRRKQFSVLLQTQSSQAATMTLAPGASSNEDSANEHAWAEQWLYVVSGTGSARIVSGDGGLQGEIRRVHEVDSCRFEFRDADAYGARRDSGYGGEPAEA